MSTRSRSGMVRYGGTRPAAVLDSVRTNPRTIRPVIGRAKPTSRTRADKGGLAAAGLQATHWPSSALTGAPQLGQTVPTNGGANPACSARQDASCCINRWAALALPAVYRQQANRPVDVTS